MMTMILQIKKILNLKHIFTKKKKNWYIFILFAFYVFLVVHHEDFWGNLNAKNGRQEDCRPWAISLDFMACRDLALGHGCGNTLPHKHHEKVSIFKLMFLLPCLVHHIFLEEKKDFLFTAVLAPDYRECRFMESECSLSSSSFSTLIKWRKNG